MSKIFPPSLGADYIGITGSVLCIIHCVATPFLLLTATWLRNDILRSSFLHLNFIFVAINALAVFSATRHATTPAIKTVLWGSLTLFAGCLLLEDISPLFGYGTYLASAGLIGGTLPVSAIAGPITIMLKTSFLHEKITRYRLEWLFGSW